jgi:hypothetical protein
MDDWLHQIDLGMVNEQGQGMVDYRGAAYRAILLGHNAASPDPATGRYYHSRYPPRHHVISALTWCRRYPGPKS